MTYWISALILVYGTWGPCIGQDLEQEIISLQPGEELSNYWKAISEEDHAHRGLSSIDSLDNLHFKKVILLLEHHGFPERGTLNAAIIPGVVFTHQRSNLVNERYFPILHKGFVEGRTDTSWYLHVLRGIHRGRFGRDLIRNRELTIANAPALLERMAPWVDLNNVDFDITPLDSLFSVDKVELDAVLRNKPRHRWADDGNQLSIYHLSDGRIYFHVMYSDGSYGEPQPMNFDKSKGRYLFNRKVLAGDYLSLLPSGDLIINMAERPRRTIKSR